MMDDRSTRYVRLETTQRALHRASTEEDAYGLYERLSLDLLGDVYGQLWCLDRDGGDAALLLMRDWGYTEQSVAPPHYRVPSGEGIIGRASQQSGVLTLNMEDAADFSYAAAPSLVVKEKLRHVHATSWPEDPTGAVLVATRKDLAPSVDPEAILDVLRLAPDVVATVMRCRRERLYECKARLTDALCKSETETAFERAAVSAICQLVQCDQAWLLMWNAQHTRLVVTAAYPRPVGDVRFVDPTPMVLAITSQALVLRLYDISEPGEFLRRGLYPADMMVLIRALDPDHRVWPRDTDPEGRLLISAVDTESDSPDAPSGIIVTYRSARSYSYLPDDASHLQEVSCLFAGMMRHLERKQQSLREITAAREVISAREYGDMVSATFRALDALFAPKVAVIASMLRTAKPRWIASDDSLVEAIDFDAHGVTLMKRRRMVEIRRDPTSPTIVLAPTEGKHGDVEVLVPIVRHQHLLGFLGLVLPEGVGRARDQTILKVLADHLAIAQSEYELSQELANVREELGHVAVDASVPDLFRALTREMLCALANIGTTAESLAGGASNSLDRRLAVARDAIVSEVIDLRNLVAIGDHIVNPVENTMAKRLLETSDVEELLLTLQAARNIEDDAVTVVGPLTNLYPRIEDQRSLLRFLIAVVATFDLNRNEGDTVQVRVRVERADEVIPWVQLDFNSALPPRGGPVQVVDRLLRQIADSLGVRYDATVDAEGRHVQVSVPAIERATRW